MSLRCLEREIVEMIEASDDIFSRQKVEFKMALNKISSTCNESTRQEAAFWLKTNEKVSI